MDTSRRLSHVRTVKFGDNIRANFLDRTDSQGHNHVAIELRRQASQGPSWVFKTDLDRLEAVIKRADEVKQSPGGLRKGITTERINDYHVDFVAGERFGSSHPVLVKLERGTDEGRSVFGISLERLKAVVREGQDVERELKYDQKRSHVLIYGESVKGESDGRLVATVFKSLDSLEAAQRLLKDNGGMALYSEPRRRPLEQGTEIQVWPEATLQLTNGNRRTVEKQLAHNDLESQSRSEHFVVARWGDPTGPPRIGSLVTWEGNGRADNGDFEDFKAKPVGCRSRGEPEEPIHVLIRRDPRLPGNGTVEAFSPNRSEMTAKLAQGEMAERQHREVSTNWNEQTLAIKQKL